MVLAYAQQDAVTNSMCQTPLGKVKFYMPWDHLAVV